VTTKGLPTLELSLLPLHVKDTWCCIQKWCQTWPPNHYTLNQGLHPRKPGVTRAPYRELAVRVDQDDPRIPIGLQRGGGDDDGAYVCVIIVLCA
jgi:hypothetical protein